jgi:hypothetical protein
MAFEVMGEEFQAVGARSLALTNYRSFLSDRDRKIATLRNTIGPDSDIWKRTESNLLKAEAQKDGIGAKLGRPIEGSQKSRWYYLIPAGLIVLLEAFMNKFLLDNAFQLPNLLTYLMSAVVTFLMLSLANLSGRMLRQCKGEYSERIFPWFIAIPVVLLTVIFGFISILTIGRAALEIVVSADINIFSEVTRQVLNHGYWKSLGIALADNNALMVAVMNLISVAVAFVAPFTRVDSDKDYQAAFDEYQAQFRSLQSMSKKYAKQLNATAKKFAPKLSSAVANYGAHNARVVAIKASKGIPLNVDDSYDLTKEDILLTRARDELEVRGKTQPSAELKAEEAAPISVVARRG